MSVRHFSCLASTRATSRMSDGEMELINKVTLPGVGLHKAIECFEMAHSRSWNHARKVSLDVWINAVTESLEDLRKSISNGQFGEVAWLYAHSPSHTPVRRAVLSFLRTLNGSKFTTSEICQFQKLRDRAGIGSTDVSECGEDTALTEEEQSLVPAGAL